MAAGSSNGAGSGGDAERGLELPEIFVDWARLTLLVVDDDEPARSMVARALDRLGVTVLTAGGGKEALRLYRERGEDVDIVLLDNFMPGMDGAETLMELRELDPDVVVLFFSGQRSSAVRERLLANGVAGFVDKPCTVGQLVDAIAKVVNERRGVGGR